LIIVGGGIAGSFMAYLEAKKGEKVVLYERNPNQEKNPKRVAEVLRPCG
jgi:2-polyprenyl-6-methoxyphenol hydroxylase and related FAD-dependent oxidoreductases